MRFSLVIDCDNVAFDGRGNLGSELARILRELADTVDGFALVDFRRSTGLYDVNGNKVGAWKME